MRYGRHDYQVLVLVSLHRVRKIQEEERDQEDRGSFIFENRKQGQTTRKIMQIAEISFLKIENKVEKTRKIKRSRTFYFESR